MTIRKTSETAAELLAKAHELLAENEALWSNLVSLLLNETGVEADDFPMSVDCAFETLKNEFNQRASDRDKLKARIAELEADNASMEEHLEEIQKENDGLMDQVEELELTLSGGK